MTRLMWSALWSTAMIAASMTGPNQAVAGDYGAVGGNCGVYGGGGACGPQIVYRTVMVPQTTYTTMTVPAVVYRPEVRQQTVNVPRCVPYTEMRTVRQTVIVPEQRTQQVSYTECHMTYQDVTSNVTVMVPQMETRQGKRMVCRPIQVQETRTVCRDLGQWVTQSFVDCCGCCRSYQCWSPNVVQEQVPVTVWRAQMVEEPYAFQVCVNRPEVRQVTHRVAKPVYEAKTREVVTTVAVPRVVERQVQLINYREVVEQKVVNYTAMVATRVERQVTVPVCTMVPKTVAVAVQPCGGGYGCGNCW